MKGWVTKKAASTALGTGEGFSWLFYNNGQVGTTFATVTISADTSVATNDRPILSIALEDGKEIWFYNDDTSDKLTGITAEKSGTGATDYSLGTENTNSALTAGWTIWGVWRIDATRALVGIYQGGFVVVTANFSTDTISWGTLNTTVTPNDDAVCQIDSTTWAFIWNAASTTVDARYITVSGTTVNVDAADTNLVGSLTGAAGIIGVSCTATRIGILYMVNTNDIHGRLVSCVAGGGTPMALVASNSLTVINDNSGTALLSNLNSVFGMMQLSWRDTETGDVFMVGTAPLNSTVTTNRFFGAWYDASAGTWRNLYNGGTSAEDENQNYAGLPSNLGTSLLRPIRGTGKYSDMGCLAVGLLSGADTVPPAISFFYMEPNLVNRATSVHRMPPMLQSNFGRISDASNALTTSNRVSLMPSNVNDLNEFTLLVNDNGSLKYKRLTIPS